MSCITHATSVVTICDIAILYQNFNFSASTTSLSLCTLIGSLSVFCLTLLAYMLPDSHARVDHTRVVKVVPVSYNMHIPSIQCINYNYYVYTSFTSLMLYISR